MAQVEHTTNDDREILGPSCRSMDLRPGIPMNGNMDRARAPYYIVPSPRLIPSHARFSPHAVRCPSVRPFVLRWRLVKSNLAGLLLFPLDGFPLRLNLCAPDDLLDRLGLSQVRVKSEDTLADRVPLLILSFLL